MFLDKKEFYQVTLLYNADASRIIWAEDAFCCELESAGTSRLIKKPPPSFIYWQDKYKNRIPVMEAAEGEGLCQSLEVSAGNLTLHPVKYFSTKKLYFRPLGSRVIWMCNFPCRNTLDGVCFFNPTGLQDSCDFYCCCWKRCSKFDIFFCRLLLKPSKRKRVERKIEETREEGKKVRKDSEEWKEQE